MTRKYFVIFVVLIFLLSQFRKSMIERAYSGDDDLPAEVLTFRTPQGWGYEIVIDDKQFIHQDFIPAVEGKKSFQSADDALRVGNYLLEKMKHSKKPFITVNELKHLKIKNV